MAGAVWSFGPRRPSQAAQQAVTKERYDYSLWRKNVGVVPGWVGKYRGGSAWRVVRALHKKCLANVVVPPSAMLTADVQDVTS